MSPETPEPVPPYLYAIVRKDFKSGALLSQYGHAVTECLRPEDLPLPDNTRIVVLGATKEELSVLRMSLDNFDVKHKAILEVDGVLAGVVTAIGLFVRDRDASINGCKSVRELLAHLKPYRG